jgi:hypothetical protein
MPTHAASEIVSKTAMVITALAFANCTPTAGVPEPAGAPTEPLRLASLATPERIAGAATAAPDRPRTEWRFDAPSGTDALSGFRAHAGVESLRVEAGQLRGRTAPPVVLEPEEAERLRALGYGD